MKILVINCGSSSLKYQLIDMEGEEVIAKGTYERIGEASFLTHKIDDKKIVLQNPVKTHKEALDFAMEQLLNKDYPAIQNLDEISAIGHRIVHGGEYFKESAIVTEDVINKQGAINSLRDVEIEDLLGREAVHLDNKNIQNLIKGKTVLVTGGRRFYWFRTL